MRGWEVLIIPAIAVVVWILATIFRGNEGQKAPPRRFPERFGDVPPQRRPIARVTRPPEELRRAQPPQRRLTPRPEPRRPVVLEEVREPLRAELAPRPVPKPVVLEIAEPEPATQTRLEAARADYKPSQSPSQAPAAPAVKPQPASATPLQVRQLLRSPQSAAAALVLREILDAPRCRRPR